MKSTPLAVSIGLLIITGILAFYACTSPSANSVNRHTEEPAQTTGIQDPHDPQETPDQPKPSGEQEKEIPMYTYKVVKTYPHDKHAFTQGLEFHDGLFYEGTGLEGKSSIRKVELNTGRVLKIKKLPEAYFGEGITLWKDQIYQLTWRSGVCFVYDKETFEKKREFRYQTEGWGLTHDGKYLIMSDGTSTLYFRDPDTFTIVKKLEVKEKEVPVTSLNELEYMKGEIYANVWQTDLIVRISPETGKVLGWIDLTGLLSESEQTPDTDVLNGIAYDAEKDRLFVTGKNWPKLLEIKIVPLKEH
jgi:glutamine cyclotransferase